MIVGPWGFFSGAHDAYYVDPFAVFCCSCCARRVFPRLHVGVSRRIVLCVLRRGIFEVYIWFRAGDIRDQRICSLAWDVYLNVWAARVW